MGAGSAGGHLRRACAPGKGRLPPGGASGRRGTALRAQPGSPAAEGHFPAGKPDLCASAGRGRPVFPGSGAAGKAPHADPVEGGNSGDRYTDERHTDGRPEPGPVCPDPGNRRKKVEGGWTVHCELRDEGRGSSVWRRSLPLPGSSARDLSAFARALADEAFTAR